jgi:hypothetical protein
MKTKIKRVKPAKYDIHFEYVCPSLCGSRHWLSLRECQQKHFRVVCDCGEVFKPKTIQDITINFTLTEKTSIETSYHAPEKIDIVSNEDDLPLPDQNFNFETFMNDCIVTLCTFGFEKNEAKTLLKESYEKNPTNNATQLVKQTLLDNFGGTSNAS